MSADAELPPAGSSSWSGGWPAPGAEAEVTVERDARWR